MAVHPLRLFVLLLALAGVVAGYAPDARATTVSLNWFDPEAGVLAPTTYVKVLSAAGGKRLVFGVTASGLFVVRLNADNSRDTTYGYLGNTGFSLGGIGEFPVDMVSLPGGGVLVVSRAVVGSDTKWYFGELDANGGLVTSFGTNGVATVGGSGDVLGSNSADGGVVFDGSGRILFCSNVSTTGVTPDYSIAVFRLSATGVADATFGSGGRITIGTATKSVVLSCGAVVPVAGGNLLVAGNSYDTATGQSRVLVSVRDTNGAAVAGQPANGYTEYNISYFNVRAGHTGPDGKAYWLGSNDVLRTGTDGAPDATFGTGGVAAFTLNPNFMGMDLGFDGVGRPRILLNDGNIGLVVLTTGGQYWFGEDVNGGTITPRSLSMDPTTGTFTVVGDNWPISPTSGRIGTVPGLAMVEIGSFGALGYVKLGGTYTQSTQLTNLNADTLSLSLSVDTAQVTLSGCPATLPAGASCTLTATIRPLVPGMVSANVTVHATAAGGRTDSATQNLGWTATGMPQPEVSATGVAMSTAPGTSISYALVIRNPSAYVMQIWNSITGAGFSLGNSCAGPLAPGSSCTLQVKFAPATAGTVLGELDISSNSDAGLLRVVVGGDTTGSGVTTMGSTLTASGGSGGGGGGAPGFFLLGLLALLAGRRSAIPA